MLLYQLCLNGVLTGVSFCARKKEALEGQANRPGMGLAG